MVKRKRGGILGRRVRLPREQRQKQMYGKVIPILPELSLHLRHPSHNRLCTCKIEQTSRPQYERIAQTSRCWSLAFKLSDRQTHWWLSLGAWTNFPHGPQMICSHKPWLTASILPPERHSDCCNAVLGSSKWWNMWQKLFTWASPEKKILFQSSAAKSLYLLQKISQCSSDWVEVF